MTQRQSLALPKDVKAYKRTSTFTTSSIPKGLLSRHNTKEGTWGLVVVEKGSLAYTIFGNASNGGENIESIVSVGSPGVIEPQVYHKIKPLSDDTLCYVEFYAREKSAVELPEFIPNGHIKDVKKDKEGNECGGVPQIIVVAVVAFMLFHK